MKILKILKKWFTLPHPCPHCRKVFETKRGLKIHIGKMHRPPLKERNNETNTR
jgi:uncharacterized C2H2 Zn-finger protein